MDKKKIVFIVLTIVSVAVSAVACVFGIPYTPVEIGYPDDVECATETVCGEEAYAAEVEGVAVSATDAKTA